MSHQTLERAGNLSASSRAFFDREGWRSFFAIPNRGVEQILEEHDLLDGYEDMERNCVVFLCK